MCSYSINCPSSLTSWLLMNFKRKYIISIEKISFQPPWNAHEFQLFTYAQAPGAKQLRAVEMPKLNFDMSKRTTVSTKMSAENKAMRINKSGENRRLEHSVLVWEQISQKWIKSEDEKEKKKERKKERSSYKTCAKKQVEILKTKRKENKSSGLSLKTKTQDWPFHF